MKADHKLIRTVAAIAVLIVACIVDRDDAVKLGIGIGMIMGVLLIRAADWIDQKFFVATLALAILAGSLQAQDTNPVPAYQQPVQFSLAVTDQQDSPIIVGAICVGVAAGIVGWIGIELVNKCLDAAWKQATNNRAPFQAQSVTSPEPVPDPEHPTAIPTGICIPCSEPIDPDALDAPLPILVETSPDGTNWVTAAVGLSRERFYIPDRGFWRASVMKLSIEIVPPDPVTLMNVKLHVPPGILEYSVRGDYWIFLAHNSTPTNMMVWPGFYRMRL